MSHFTRKKIEPTARVCFRLKEARKAAGLSIEQMAEKTRLSKAYIRALEACEFDHLPNGTIYQKNFIKKYLAVLGISSTTYIQQFLLEEGYNGQEQDAPPTHPYTPKSVFSFHALPALMKYIGVSLVLVSVLGYLGWQIHRILEPPLLTLIEPIDGHITTEEHIVIRGISDPETHIAINGRDVSFTEAGRFEQQLDLVEGVNTIIVSATKKHGKTTTQTRYVTQRPVQLISVQESQDTNS